MARVVSGRNGAQKSRAHVLVVEPDTDISQLVTLILEEEGYRVTCARGGSIGLMVMRSTLHPMVVWVAERLGDLSLEEFLAAVASDASLECHAPVLFVHHPDAIADLRTKYPALTQRVVGLPVSSDDMLATIGDAATSIATTP
jgi:DNA-binding NtrC family response regulator